MTGAAGELATWTALRTRQHSESEGGLTEALVASGTLPVGQANGWLPG
jgi:hypothetical protein